MLGRLFGYGETPTYHTDEPPQEDETEDNFLASANGSLYVSSKSSDGASDQTCMYISCVARVRPTARQFSYELIVSRCDEDNASDAYPVDVVFAIEPSAGFNCTENQCGWSDRSGKRYNMDIDTEAEADKLRIAIGAALFQHIHKRDPSVEDAEELRMLVAEQKVTTSAEELIPAGELERVEGELYTFDVEKSEFELIAPAVTATINSAVVKEDNSRAYMILITARDSDTRILACEVSNDLSVRFYTQTLSLVWVLDLGAKSPDGPDASDSDSRTCISLKLHDAEDFRRFRNCFIMSLYEVTQQASMDDLKLKDDDRDYIEASARDDVDPMEVDEGDEEEDTRDISDEVPGRRASVGNFDDGMRNSHLAVSANNDRTFVVRGNKMGVFQTGSDGAKFTTSVKFTDPQSKKAFNPSNILLHEKDTSMLVLDPQDNNRIMRMDLERGEVVDTWSGPVMRSTPLNAVHRVAKYSNLTDTKEFVGLNKNNLVHMDPRTKEFIVKTKKYAASTRAKLDCVATTGGGNLAVASENGDIRLFDSIGKNAKTHLPGLGDRIIGIDVSEDGRYVLATTAKYLLVINTVVQGENETSGFKKSMGKHKPAPRKLVLKPEDIVKHRMGEINFTTAHFNTGTSLERSIVTSTGPFLITWNFRSVKLGRLDNYKIARYEDNVVADDFAFNNDGRIVVTLPNDVSVATRR